MCVRCCDCLSLSQPGKPYTAICNGFSNPETKKYVVKDGYFTENYRWCSGWSMEQIKQKEKQEIESQQKWLGK